MVCGIVRGLGFTFEFWFRFWLKFERRRGFRLGKLISVRFTLSKWSLGVDEEEVVSMSFFNFPFSLPCPCSPSLNVEYPFLLLSPALLWVLASSFHSGVWLTFSSGELLFSFEEDVFLSDFFWALASSLSKSKYLFIYGINLI